MTLADKLHHNTEYQRCFRVLLFAGVTGPRPLVLRLVLGATGSVDTGSSSPDEPRSDAAVESRDDRRVALGVDGATRSSSLRFEERNFFV